MRVVLVIVLVVVSAGSLARLWSLLVCGQIHSKPSSKRENGGINQFREGPLDQGLSKFSYKANLRVLVKRRKVDRLN